MRGVLIFSNTDEKYRILHPSLLLLKVLPFCFIIIAMCLGEKQKQIPESFLAGFSSCLFRFSSVDFLHLEISLPFVSVPASPWKLTTSLTDLLSYEVSAKFWCIVFKEETTWGYLWRLFFTYIFITSFRQWCLNNRASAIKRGFLLVQVIGRNFTSSSLVPAMLGGKKKPKKKKTAFNMWAVWLWYWSY